VDLGELYRDGQRRVVALVGELGPEELRARVPGCPRWTVRDVVAHVTGVSGDIATGNLTGAATDEWTTAQVERGLGRSVAELVEQWTANLPAVLDFLAAHPRQPAAAIDLAAHEQDIRGAVGRPGARDNAIIRTMTPVMLRGLNVPEPLVVRTEDGEARIGPEDGAPAVLAVDRFEAFRLRLGRRSRGQVARLDWSADPEPYLDHLFLFGPSPIDIVA
jgi:uncharacterized protein (TIGR03083 family)